MVKDVLQMIAEMLDELFIEISEYTDANTEKASKKLAEIKEVIKQLD
jgi:hypothetical protein